MYHFQHSYYMHVALMVGAGVLHACHHHACNLVRGYSTLFRIGPKMCDLFAVHHDWQLNNCLMLHVHKSKTDECTSSRNSQGICYVK